MNEYQDCWNNSVWPSGSRQPGCNVGIDPGAATHVLRRQAHQRAPNGKEFNWPWLINKMLANDQRPFELCITGEHGQRHALGRRTSADRK